MPEVDEEQGTELPVGEYLRRTRESRGLGLEEASRVTKIGKNYLVAIEQGEFEKLPNPAYIKGFLRLYAGFLSLSGDEVVQRYQQSAPQARPQAEARPERPSVEIMERAKLGGHGRWVIPVLLLALVILAALFLSDGEEKRRPAAKRAEAPALLPAKAPVQPRRSSAAPPAAAPAQPPVPSQLPVQPPASATPGEASHQPPNQPPAQSPTPARNPAGTATPATAQLPAPARPRAAASPAPRRSGVVLRLRFNQDSWLSITIDDSISQRYDLKAGDIIEWKGARTFALDIGDGAAAEGDFNGKPFKSLGEAGKPAHLELKGE